MSRGAEERNAGTGELSGSAPRTTRKLAWISLLYFGSGLPYGVFKELVPVWLRSAGVGLDSISYLVNPLSSAWSLKVLWSPLVDRSGGRRRWISGGLLACGLSLAAVSFVEPQASGVLVLLFAVFVIASATQDIAVDAYTIGIVSKGQEGPANSVRVTAYRIAMWVAGGAAVALAAWLPWSGVILAVALVFVVLAVIVPLAPPIAVARGQTLAALFRGLRNWIREPGAIPLAAFILLYKMPDAALGVMTRTFWVDAGIGVDEIGKLLAPLTLIATVAGAAAGGVIVAKTGLLRGLLWLGLAQSLSNASYSIADWAGRPRGGVIAAAGIESFCSGLSTAAFLALLMRVCEKKRAATEYALLTALFAATRELTGAASGDGVELLGYGGWFAATMLLAVPSLALLFTRPLGARAREDPLRLPWITGART